MQARIIGMAALLALLGTAALAGTRAITFEGATARDQDPQLMEKGMLRSELRVIRSLRVREQAWLIAAPQDVWEQTVAPALLAALDADPKGFGDAMAALPSTVARSGPAIEGGQLRVKLASNGDGLVSVHLPALLSSVPDGAPLLNAAAPNRAHLLAGFELNGGSTVSAMHVPRGLRPLSRGLPPRVPLQPVEGTAGWVGLGDRDGSGDSARPLRKELDRQKTLSTADVSDLEAWPRRSGSLVDHLRSVRLDARALAVPEGPYRTLTQDPSGYATESRTVRHPSRYVALTAPIAAAGDGGGAMMVFGVIGFYRPLLLTLEEAPLALGVDAVALARAVHAGELPFVEDGGDVLFYGPWLERWNSGKAKSLKGKVWSRAEAAEAVKGWGEKYGLRSLVRAADMTLPQRMVTIPEKERAELIDSKQVARGRFWLEDVAAWLKHQEPGLKQGKQAPLWSYRAVRGAERIEASFSLPSGAVASSTRPSYLGGLGGARSSGGGGGAEALGSGGGGGGTAITSDLAIEILEMYTGSAFCPLGREADAGVELALDGLGEGQTARLQVEWDLVMKGRSVRRDAFSIDREAGTHEVDFEVPCPDTAGGAELELVLVDADGNIAAEATLAMDVRAPGGRSWAALKKPAPKTCLTADLGGGGDDFSVAKTKGLSAEQVRAGVRGFQEQTLRCHDGSGASGQVQLELHVGCDGVVISADVLEDGTGDAAFSECVAETFAYAPFAAHDRDGGVVFVVPLRYD